ncbi:MAG: SET domain-containing protein-lysine N-methyltransferase [Bacteroidetes bacterium]|nr:SET domain-containing protein-lysine N-methyltransferase [Bacteroidota bacterium]
MKKDRFSVLIKKSNIDGKGLFALESIPARKKVGELEGDLISIRKARQLAAKSKRISIVEVDDDYALYAAEKDTTYRFINHSCQPNTYMRIFKRHVEFYALTNIKKGEELTCNYGETHHDGKLKCRCGAKNCIGFL